jgi:hypothetical protein
MLRVDTLLPGLLQPTSDRRPIRASFRDWYGAGFTEILPIVPPDAKVDGGALLKSRGKAPGVLGADGAWHGLPGWRDREVSEADIVDWTASGAGIGLRRGAALPLDIDITDTDLSERVKQIAFDVLGPAPVRTGRAPKCVLLYRAEGAFRPSQGKLTIAAEPQPHQIELPSQVVVEGVHPVTGRPYAWDMRLRFENLTPVTQSQLDRFMQEVERSVPGARRSKHSPATERPPEQLAAAKGKEDLIEEIVRKLPNDRANFPNRADMIDMLTAVKGALSDRPDAAEDLARDWAERWEGEGFTHEEFDKDWGSITPRALGAGYLLRKAEEIIPAAAGAAPWTVRYWFDPVAEMDVGDSSGKQPVVRIRAFRPRPASAIPPREALYGDHRIRRFLSATIAPGGLGKSSLTIVEALAMVTGRPLLEVRPPRPLRVWLWNGEDPFEEIERRVTAAMMHFGLSEADLGDRLFIESGRDFPISLVRAERGAPQIDIAARDDLLQQLLGRGIDALIVDPFAYSHRVLENDNSAIALVAATWSDIAERANCSVELVHHARKTGGAEVGVEDARGASALVAATRSSRTLVRMSEDEAKQLRVTDAHGRYFREGGDPKRNLSPPPLTNRTLWFRTVGVALGNGTAEFPRGDEVGVAERFHPSVTPEEVAAASASKEKAAVLQAILRAIKEVDSNRLADLLGVVGREVAAAGVSKAQSRPAIQMLVSRHTDGDGGLTTDADGRTVRVFARKAGNALTSPWLIEVEEVPDQLLASDANSGGLHDLQD